MQHELFTWDGMLSSSEYVRVWIPYVRCGMLGVYWGVGWGGKVSHRFVCTVRNSAAGIVPWRVPTPRGLLAEMSRPRLLGCRRTAARGLILIPTITWEQVCAGSPSDPRAADCRCACVPSARPPFAADLFARVKHRSDCSLNGKTPEQMLPRRCLLPGQTQVSSREAPPAQRCGRGPRRPARTRESTSTHATT
jgi:hypothetical protein